MSDGVVIQSIIQMVRDHYQTQDFIPLHAPVFRGNEKEFVTETIESTFVSSVGSFVDRFEQDMAQYTGSPRAVAVVNGTAALHLALKLAGVQQNDLVITQPLTFVATCNAIHYCGADPVFIDIDRHTLGLSPTAMETWLESEAFIDDQGYCRHRDSNRIIRACVPMHTFGHPADLHGLILVCQKWHLALVEDAAESLGSLYHGRHTGTFGLLGTLSFNGNKIITTGGGGMLLAGEEIGARAKHLSTTAKLPHAYEYEHDEVGYNYRLPNLNAALGCAQLLQLNEFIEEKRQLAAYYQDFFHTTNYSFISEPEGCRSNYWLNAIICPDPEARNHLLETTNNKNVMTRPVWKLMHQLNIYNTCLRGDLSNSEFISERLVNLPSSIKN
ncbi:MAG: LegC family aminotransferase [Marinospirillum sp.]|uniref:LegC family aminotransferase n=1 Tax=Marinospirillum sp. TaxID=2183934 RepID=UPI001A030805|nr:LegC family aminotransferase [Marinospirillum sp.]MBE0508205.1 LegC family aminotransferase [Marinospirillum sp.]